MSSRFTRMTFLAAAASLALAGPMAAAAADRQADPACAALENSLMPVPDWYAERCLGGAAVTDYSQYKEVAGLIPGDTAFYKINFPAPLDIRTAPLQTLTFTTVGPNAQALFAMTFDTTATTLYAVDNTSRQLGTINLTTGAFTSIGALSPNPAGTVTGLAFDPTSTNVYFTATNGSTANLWTIDVTNAALTLVGPITGFPFTIDMAIDNTGQIYGHDIAVDALITINKTTGAGTLVGPTFLAANFAQGMMYDNSDDTLYGCAFVTAPVLQGQLVRFNKTTGTATVLAIAPEEMECGVQVPATQPQPLEPAALAVDAANNGVLQPNEAAVVVAPSWTNPNASAVAGVAGVLSAFTGPAGPTYTIDDSAATYGTIPATTTQSCGADCYAVTATSATRPATHWDASALETVTPGAVTRTWTLHVGDSFTDVLPANGFYRFVETILHKNVTGGCTATTYCPSDSTSREAMAVFVLVSKEPAGYMPPACVAGSELFADVPASSGFCPWIEELANRGVVSGCGGSNYCPSDPATREQMAVFVLRTLDPVLNPPDCIAGSEQFADVPATSGFCKWIEELANRGVVTGCGGGNYCPTNPVTREQMSVFLTVTFSIALYGL